MRGQSVAGQHTAVDQRHVVTHAGQQQSRRRPGATRAHDHHVVVVTGGHRFSFGRAGGAIGDYDFAGQAAANLGDDAPKTWNMGRM